ncbi:MAG: galactose oxidase [Prevotellaceae bacterium]|jgi:N-acetylneuraminic acid mutarotase|nr:galactose oxidase [Prevotellaceae bacterium]
MKIRNLYLLLVVFFALGCKNSDTEEELIGNWTYLGDFDGSARNDASSFVIGDTAYICLGFNSKKALIDLYRYDAGTKTWKQRADFPGKPRYAASAFVANGKAYVGLGVNGVEIYDDFWAYDPATNKWDSVTAPFPGGGRYYAIAAAVNNVGIVGTGTNEEKGDLKDFYSFTPGSTPGSGTWTALSGPEGSKRQGASVFVIGNYLYLLGGITNNGNPVDMQKYDLAADRWEKVMDLRNTDQTTDDDKYDQISRAYACAFVINGNGYITLGQKSSSPVPTTFEYVPSENRWYEKTGFSRSTRTGAVAFSLSQTSKARGFIMTGRSSSTRFDDFIEFHPAATNNTYDD